MAAARSEYQYDELPPGDNIRLLRLFSGTGTTKVQCKLVVHSLDSHDLPNYRAVSYAWNNIAPLRPVICSDRLVWVRENLFELLQYARHSKFDCWLWIDAICINQTSDSERNHQVKLMGNIYTKCNSVLAWLGPPSDLLSCVFGTIQHMAQNKNALIMSYIGDSNYLGENIDICEGIVKFAELRYWTRKWIIQELVLARSVVLYVGNTAMSMNEVERIFDQDGCVKNPFLHVVERRRQVWDLDIKRWEDTVARSLGPGSAVSTLARHRVEYRENRHPKTLRELAIRYDKSNCSVPCDHYYALFNLIGEHRAYLQISYEKSWPAHCEAILSFMIFHEGLPFPEIVNMAKTLSEKFGIDQKVAETAASLGPDFSLDQVPTLSPFFSKIPLMDIPIFELGRVYPHMETSDVLRFRDSLHGFSVMPKLGMRCHGSYFWSEPLAVSSDSPLERQELISPLDLCCFSLQLGDEMALGFASCTIISGDRLWRLPGTDISFIVRPTFDKSTEHDRLSNDDLPLDRCVMVGRAVLQMPTKNLDLVTQGSQSQPTASSMKSLLSIIRKVTKPADRRSSLNRNLRLYSNEVFELAFYATQASWALNLFALERQRRLEYEARIMMASFQ
jgi:hypothetical protein